MQMLDQHTKEIMNFYLMSDFKISIILIYLSRTVIFIFMYFAS